MLRIPLASCMEKSTTMPHKQRKKKCKMKSLSRSKASKQERETQHFAMPLNLQVFVLIVLFVIPSVFNSSPWKGLDLQTNNPPFAAEAVAPLIQNHTGGNKAPVRVGIVLTSFFRFRPDPQRHTTPAPTFKAFANLYSSLNFHRMPAVLFHDDLPDSLVESYSTPLINFLKMEVPTNMTMSTNDFRFKVYSKFLEEVPVQYKYVLMVDAFDTFFLGDPFQYMEEHGRQMYFSADKGPFYAHAWRVRECYGSIEPKKWNHSLPMVNAGVWGGQQEFTMCLLNCVNEQLSVPSRSQRNCNMPAVNWCAHFSGCLSDEPVQPDPILVNPFRLECMGDPHHIIVHNKCKDTEGKLCLETQGGKLVPVPRRSTAPCPLIHAGQGGNASVTSTAADSNEESVQDVVTKCRPMTKKQKIELASEIKDYEKSQRFTNKINEVKTRRATPIHSAIAKYLMANVLESNWSVLELGCAAGMMLQMVGDAYKVNANLGPAKDLVGVELTTGWVKFAESHFNDISIYEGDITDFDLPAPRATATFDFVMLNDVMEHIQKERYGCFFDKLQKVTHVGSVVYMHTPTPEFQLTETHQYFENVLPHHHVVMGMALAGFELVALDHDMEVGCLRKTPTLHVPKRIRTEGNCASPHSGKWPLFYHMVFHRSADERVFKLH